MNSSRFKLSVVLFIFVLFSGYSQEINHWESVVLSDAQAKYFPGFIAPDDQWETHGFDDSNWNDGFCSLGYGDGDDLTVISPVLSAYLRTNFTIVDKSKITAAVLHMDYDDAFVAYLNGVEIARANIGVEGIEPSFDTPASSNHEALLYQGGTPETFNVNRDALQSLIRDGENVLAIQVHNVVSNSSDMTCMPFLSVGIADESRHYRETPEWFTPPVQEFTSSNLPILIINTEGGASIPNEPKVNATLKVAYNEDGQRNNVAGPYHTEFSGPIGIETRGNVTQSFPKKPYLFETRDETGANRNIELFGLPSENDWVLRACYLDKTLMRNAIACKMSRDMGRYASRVVFCEVILNGSYDGVYLLMEQVKRDNNRVDVEKLYPSTTDADSIKGGYIYQVSQTPADFGERRSLVYPDKEDINMEQLDYIRSYDDQFRAIMNQDDYADPKTGYPAWIDVQSFIDEIIVQEAVKNSDAYGWSSFFHKNRWQKLAAGPVWDFDQALANSTWNDGRNASEWIITKSNNSVPTFWAKLFNEPKFKYLFKRRWFELRNTVLRTDSLLSYIDETASLLDEAQQRNFQRWPVLGKELWRSLPGWNERDTYQKEVDYMKDFLVEHLEWMDLQLSAVYNQSIPLPDLVISEIMYSAYSGPEFEYLKIDNAGNTPVDLTGVFFADGIEYSFENNQSMGVGGSAILAHNPASYLARYGSEANGMYHGKLDNKGEKLELNNSYGLTIDFVQYSDTSPWPVSNPENPGPIVLNDLFADNSLPENWAFKETGIELPDLVISEIMYDPPEGSDYEFVEIVNAGTEDVDLTGISITDAIDYTFPSGLILAAGDIIVVASQNLLFELKYGFSVQGDFLGKLNNTGERIMLQDSDGNVIDLVEYDNTDPWPVVDAANAGSIELQDLRSDNSLAQNWKRSGSSNGTPMNLLSTVSATTSEYGKITVYPVPASDVLNIGLHEIGDADLKLEIYDLTGALRISKDISDRFGGVAQVNVSELPAGTFLLKLAGPDSTIIEKIVIRR